MKYVRRQAFIRIRKLTFDVPPQLPPTNLVSNTRLSLEPRRGKVRLVASTYWLRLRRHRIPTGNLSQPPLLSFISNLLRRIFRETRCRPVLYGWVTCVVSRALVFGVDLPPENNSHEFTKGVQFRSSFPRYRTDCLRRLKSDWLRVLDAEGQHFRFSGENVSNSNQLQGLWIRAEL